MLSMSIRKVIMAAALQVQIGACIVHPLSLMHMPVEYALYEIHTTCVAAVQHARAIATRCNAGRTVCGTECKLDVCASRKDVLTFTLNCHRLTSEEA